MTQYDRYFSAKPIIFGRAPAAPASIINVSEFNQIVDLGVTFATAAKLDITSSSTSDAAAGTGARTLEIAGLDFDGNPLFETITLNGQTIVTTTKDFWRVFGAQAMTFGTGRKNAGDLYIVKTGTGGTYTTGVPGTLTSAMVKVLANESLGTSGFFTAPRGMIYKIESWRQGSRVQVAKHMIFKGSERIVPASPPNLDIAIDLPVGVPVPIDEACGITVNELEDIYFRCLSGAAAGVVSFLTLFTRV